MENAINGFRSIIQSIAQIVVLLSTIVVIAGPFGRARSDAPKNIRRESNEAYVKPRTDKKSFHGLNRIAILAADIIPVFIELALTITGPSMSLSSTYLIWMNGSDTMDTGGMGGLLLLVITGGLIGIVISAIWEIVLLRISTRSQ